MIKIRLCLKLIIISIIPLIVTSCATPGDPNTQQGCAQEARRDSALCSLSCGVFPQNAYEIDLQSQCKSRCSVNENMSLTRCDRLPQAQIQPPPQARIQQQPQPVTLQDVRAKFKEDYRLAAIAAEQGDAQAQANLGQMYETGRGVTKDHKEAVKWYRLAAEQRNVDGQSRLGAMYENGHGVAKDYAEALRLYKLSADQGNATAQLNIDTLNQKLTVVKKYNDDYQLAAEQGDAKAQANLGFINAKEQNYTEAMKWFRLAAEQGNASAQTNLGIMYQKGHGVPQDYARAHMWFNLASAAGYARGTTNRDKLAKEITPQQIEKAQEMAKACQARNFKGC